MAGWDRRPPMCRVSDAIHKHPLYFSEFFELCRIVSAVGQGIRGEETAHSPLPRDARNNSRWRPLPTYPIAVDVGIM